MLTKGEKMFLNELQVGKSARIINVGGEGALRQHILDMGMIPASEVTLVKFAPMGDPMEIRTNGYLLTLRLADAKNIEIVEIDSVHSNDVVHDAPIRDAHSTHPGYGEEGKYHVKADENPLPDDQKLTFALAGNHNSGKTSLFNQLTGENLHVGNFPGTTTERVSGAIRNHPEATVTDLPGIYSLSPYTSDEIISREFILEEKPTGIINIVDSTNIERNLYLTLQLMELDVPIVLALNMMDEVRENGGTILINEMEEMLGIPVVPISASDNEGIEELLGHAFHVAHYQEKPGRNDFCDKDYKGGAVHRAIHGIMHLIEDHAKKAGLPVRFAATKLIEGDSRVRESLELTDNELDMIEHIIVQMEEERRLDRAAAIADMRFSFIHKLCEMTVIRPSVTKEDTRSRKMDSILTGRFTAIPSFIIIMGLVFYLTFSVIGAWGQRKLAQGIVWVTDLTDQALTAGNVSDALHSLIIDGVFAGVGSILSFVPLIVVLFFFLSILEDSGYMARVAFIMDKPLRKIGLSGRSIVPMLIGFGCSVPAIMSARTLPSARDRKMTIMLTPFMSCTAKLPVYGFFTVAFFPEHAGIILICLYLLGILTGLGVALLTKGTVFKGGAVPFVMELPNYRPPGAKNVLHLLWDKAWDFIKRAFTVIFVASIIIWFLQSFNFHLTMVDSSDESILAIIAGFVSPIFNIQGFGNWMVVTALIAGFMQKESVVSTLSVLCGTGAALTAILTPLSTLSLLVFCLLYTPCVAAIASVKHELGMKWAVIMVTGQCLIAWIMSLAVYIIGSMII